MQPIQPEINTGFTIGVVENPTNSQIYVLNSSLPTVWRSNIVNHVRLTRDTPYVLLASNNPAISNFLSQNGYNRGGALIRLDYFESQTLSYPPIKINNIVALPSSDLIPPSSTSQQPQIALNPGQIYEQATIQSNLNAPALFNFGPVGGVNGQERRMLCAEPQIYLSVANEGQY